MKRKAMATVTGPDEWGSMYVALKDIGKGEAVRQVGKELTVIFDYDKGGNMLGIEILSAPPSSIAAEGEER